MAYVTLLDAATATGVGPSFKNEDQPRAHTLQCSMGGTVVATAVTVELEGSLDRVKWFTLATHPFSSAEITAEAAMFHVADKPVNFIRANLATLTGGTDPNVTVLYHNNPG